MTEIYQTLDDVVVERQADIGLPDHEVLLSKIVPFHAFLLAKRMSPREGDKEALGPKLSDFATWHLRGTHHECNINPPLGDERDMFAQPVLGNLQTHTRIAFDVRMHQFPQETSGDRRKDANP
jgi:hypothetical protein